MWFSLWNASENVEWNWSDFGALYNPGSIQQGNKKAQKTQLLLTSCFWLRALSLTLSQVLSASVSSLCFWLGPLPGSFCLSAHTFTRLCHLLGLSWMLLLAFLILPLSVMSFVFSFSDPLLIVSEALLLPLWSLLFWGAPAYTSTGFCTMVPDVEDDHVQFTADMGPMPFRSPRAFLEPSQVL